MVDLNQVEKSLAGRFAEIDEVSLFNQQKVLDAFFAEKVASVDFAGTTGYGYDDRGREKLCRVYARTFGGEKAIVSPLLSCGTHAISTVLFGLLRPGDVMLSISGSPYDTIHETIFGKGNGSLADFGVKYEEIPLKNGLLDSEKILQRVRALKPKMAYLQRSRGYSDRKAFSCADMEPIFSEIKRISPDTFIVVDNCYGEFTEKREPCQVLADVIVGSLIKNPGGSLAPSGGYIVGSSKAVDQIASRYTCPSLKTEVGSFEAGYRLFFQGFFLAPHFVGEALKGGALIAGVLEEKGLKVFPSSKEPCSDIIRSVYFDDKESLISFVQLVQRISPVDSFVTPLPWAMPGYQDEVIMSAGTFVSGASLELSCDSPIRKPYIAYFQGGVTYQQLKIFASLNCI